MEILTFIASLACHVILNSNGFLFSLFKHSNQLADRDLLDFSEIFDLVFIKLPDCLLYLACLNEGRNAVFARTTKRTPPAPREGLFWSRKPFTWLVSVKMGISFLIGHPATPVLRTAAIVS